MARQFITLSLLEHPNAAIGRFAFTGMREPRQFSEVAVLQGLMNAPSAILSMCVLMKHPAKYGLV